VVECGLTFKVKDIDLVIIKGKKVSIYSIYNLNLTTTDIYKTIKSYWYNFVAYDFDILRDITIILGFL